MLNAAICRSTIKRLGLGMRKVRKEAMEGLPKQIQEAL